MLGWSHSIYIQNLSSIGPMVNEIQYNGDLTFDLNLRNQDGLISTWPYYVICLSGHTPYAYKIWAQLDQWFSSYKTKGNVCVGVCACVCDIGIRKWVNPKRAGLFCLSQVRGGADSAPPSDLSRGATKNSEIWHVRRVHQYARADKIAMLKIKPFFNYANLC